MTITLSGKWKNAKSWAPSRGHQEDGGLGSVLEGQACLKAAVLRCGLHTRGGLRDVHEQLLITSSMSANNIPPFQGESPSYTTYMCQAPF